jgi:STE24 endopeptidase
MLLTNPWFIAAFVGLILWCHVKLLAEFLNLSRLRRTPPDSLKDVMTAEDCERAANYAIASARVHCMQDALMLGLALGFWLCGGFSFLEKGVLGLGLTPVWTGVVSILLLLLAQNIISLPFEWWSTFRVEAAFDLNKTTWQTFVIDRVKGLLLGAVLGLPLLAALLWFFYSSEWAALWSWLTTSAFGLLMTWLAPRFIMPWFMKFSPLEEGSLKQSIMRLAEQQAFPVQDIFIVDGSRRSSKANAFFTGFGNTRRIALFDTLLTAHTNEEILAVLAHEMGHAKLGHVPKQIIIGVMQSALMFGLLHLALRSQALYTAAGVSVGNVALGMVFFSMVYSAWNWLLEAPLQTITRKHEFQADAFAKAALGSSTAMSSCLKKLSRNHLAHLTPHPFYVWLHDSHPPVAQRLTALE